MKRNLQVLRDCLKKNIIALVLYFAVPVICFSIFLLYELPMEPFIYAAVVFAVLGLFLFMLDYARERVKANERAHILQSLPTSEDSLPLSGSLLEKDYQTLVKRLGVLLDEAEISFTEKQQEEEDYYTSWVHQIKTPIAVMKLQLSDGTEKERALSAELFRIEQYVGMVLQYLRMNAEGNDLVIREINLDELIKESVRKFAPQFILKKLHLSYEPTDLRVVTDAKWLSCIIEQFLSNAVKYTAEGTVSIAVRDGELRISDTGIGIAPEDLPRIFEKGYTGLNGRVGQNSSGLGLYLAKKAADKLSIPVRAESVLGEGSTFILDLRQPLERLVHD